MPIVTKSFVRVTSRTEIPKGRSDAFDVLRSGSDMFRFGVTEEGRFIIDKKDGANWLNIITRGVS